MLEWWRDFLCFILASITELSRRDAVAEYLRSFYFVTDGGRVFQCVFNQRAGTRTWNAWSSFLFLWLWIKLAHQIQDRQQTTLVFLKSTTRTRTSDIYAISLKELVLSIHISFPCYTTDEQTLSMPFDFHVIVQYKGEANVCLNPKAVDSLHFLWYPLFVTE